MTHSEKTPIENLADRPASHPVKPDLRFMFSHPAHVIALGLGSGLAPFAPGTSGSLWAWVVWLLLGLFLDPAQLLILLAISLPVGWWACTVTARHLQTPDPSAIVIDEIVAFWLVLAVLLPAGLWTQIAAFVLFRAFDAIKKGPVGWADALFHDATGWRGGWGIMFDDLVAAACTLLVMAVLIRIFA